MRRYSLPFFLMLSVLTNGCGRALELDPQNNSSFALKGDSVDRRAEKSSDVIVQLFNWPFAKITAELPLLANSGYGAVHVSPPNLTISGNEWWARYQPVDYRLIAGPLGNESQFRAMINEAHSYGIKIIVDIVFNHMANPSSPLPPETAEILATQGPLFTAQDFHPAACIRDYDSVQEVRNNRICGGEGDQGLPDLTQSSARVLSEQKAFLQRLTAMGVDGYRFDAVKHMEPSYFKSLLTEDVATNKIIFGEIIADAGTYDRDIQPYMATQTLNFYDFPLRSTIQQAFSANGSLASLVDTNLVDSKKSLPPGRGIGFVMNHDIPNNDGFRYMILDSVDEELAYAYLLGREGTTPYIYSDLGAKGGGGLRDERWAYAHRNPKLISLIKFHNAVAGERQTTIAADDCFVALQRGQKGIILINKCQAAKSLDISQKFAGSVRMIDLATGAEVDWQQDITVAARSSLTLVSQ